MEYSVNDLAKLSGLSARTLRYYDEIGLLEPLRNEANQYRVYSTDHVDRLQQIMFFKQLGISLGEIRLLLDDPCFDREKTLADHLTELRKRRKQIDLLIYNVERTLASVKGESVMNDREKFEAFKKSRIDENERKYGKEIRERFGEEAVNTSNEKFRKMTPDQYALAERLSEELGAALLSAFYTGDPAGEQAAKAAELHKQWLCCFWPEGSYSKKAHAALAQNYVEDERFAAYYDKLAPGCTVFLRDAVLIYCEDK